MQIKFDKRFVKLKDVENGDEVVLLDVFERELVTLSPEFKSYDTKAEDNTYYALPPLGKAIVLLFQHKRSRRIFSTIREYSDHKWNDYVLSRGQTYEVLIKSESICKTCGHKLCDFEPRIDCVSYTDKIKIGDEVFEKVLKLSQILGYGDPRKDPRTIDALLKAYKESYKGEI